MADLQFERETRAIKALDKLLDQAKEVRDLYQSASLPMPAPLSRLFGETLRAKEGMNGGPNIPAMPMPDAPSERQEDWIWLPFAGLRPISLVKGVLRVGGEPMKPKDIIEKVEEMTSDYSATVIYNAGTRLSELGIVEKTEEGWRLAMPEMAPVLHAQHMWGPAKIFQRQEVASYRRRLIVHLLNVFTDGLQVVQIVGHLKKLGQCHAPVNKDLVKEDMNALYKERRAKRTGNSGKWVAVKEE